MDYLIKVFSDGFSDPEDGVQPTYNVDFNRIKSRIRKYEKDTAAAKGKEPEGSKSKTKGAEVGKGEETGKAKDAVKTPQVVEAVKEVGKVGKVPGVVGEGQMPQVEKEAAKVGKVPRVVEEVRTPRVEKEAAKVGKVPRVVEEMPRVEEVARVKKVPRVVEVVQTPRVEKEAVKAGKVPRVEEVAKVGKAVQRKLAPKQGPKQAGPAGAGAEGGESGKGKVPREVEATKKRPAAQVKAKKVIKSRSEVGTTDEEGEVVVREKGKAEGSGMKKTQQKRRAEVSDVEVSEEEGGQAKRRKVLEVVEDDSEDEVAAKTKGKQRERKEESEDEGEELAPLEKSRRRAESKAPPPPPSDCIEVEEKCARCSKLRMSCLWTPDAIKKAGPKACWRCKKAKVGCINSYRGSGPMGIDLGTPLDDLVDHLAPPVSNAAGVPRSGTAGETENPTTLGELLVEVLANTRAVKEENMELKGQMKAMRQALETMMFHNGQSQRQVLDAIKDIPSAPAPVWTPRALPTIPPSSPPRPSPRPSHSPSLSPLPLLAKPIQGRLVVSDTEDESPSSAESTPRRPTSRAESSASRANNDEEIEEVGVIPSVVADRTRGRTKAAASPKEVSGEEDDEEQEEVEEESPKKAKATKRKATAVEDTEVPAKKPKVAAAGKGKEAKAVPARKPAAKKGKSTAS